MLNIVLFLVLWYNFKNTFTGDIMLLLELDMIKIRWLLLISSIISGNSFECSLTLSCLALFVSEALNTFLQYSLFFFWHIEIHSALMILLLCFCDLNVIIVERLFLEILRGVIEQGEDEELQGTGCTPAPSPLWDSHLLSLLLSQTPSEKQFLTERRKIIA